MEASGDGLLLNMCAILRHTHFFGAFWENASIHAFNTAPESIFCPTKICYINPGADLAWNGMDGFSPANCPREFDGVHVTYRATELAHIFVLLLSDIVTIIAVCPFAARFGAVKELQALATCCRSLGRYKFLFFVFLDFFIPLVAVVAPKKSRKRRIRTRWCASSAA